MDIAQYEGSTVNINTELSKVSKHDRKKVIEKYRRIAEKGAMTCPFCSEKLLLRAGEIREIHFAHPAGKTCQEADAYDTYRKQTRRENKKHSIIKEAIYTELKSQEVIKPDLRVEYGYKEKAAEKWRHYPDIYMNKGGREFAISVITHVHEIGDEKVVKTISKRNQYFAAKGLETIWFVEDRELADDFEHRVLHLWEAEYGLAIKTVADRLWDAFLEGIMQDFPYNNIFELFRYRSYARMHFDVRSLYYVHSTDDEITFSVYRMILDKKRKPFRAFALNRGYRMHMSSALIVRDEIVLSREEQEDQDRIQFAIEVAERIEQLREEKIAQEETRFAEHIAAEEVTKQNARSRVQALPPEYQQAVAAAAEIVHVDIDVLEYMDKLKTATISAQEAKKLFYYMERHRSELDDYGLSFDEVKRHINYALGRVGNPDIRKWLVEVEYL
ncbi:competence protein CoiA [Paenibacillus mesophilus]|uniref:competence protein CoiA family protein n=1 Tax=Paenibacillus mesophilus TaxID=2582849 RepID=UPI00110DEF2C|nr:competence protein CoiA family protein [Paenibacillus mesophilus]TMV43044.1 competence protein CoiA [Paenibacillus mesophilus]